MDTEEQDRDYGRPGHQLVEVDGHLTYAWAGSRPLEVGDEVVLPPSWVDQLKGKAGNRRGRVTALGSTYTGDVASILGRA